MYVQPVRIPTNCFASTNVDVIAIGHGKTSDASDVSANLKYAHLKIIPFEDCGKLYPDTAFFGSYICAKSAVNDYQSVCGGDSGGPLITNSDYTLVGIAAFITKCKTYIYLFISLLFYLCSLCF